MADAKSGPYASVKNRRSRMPNKRPYDSFAEGAAEAHPPKIHNRATESEGQVKTPPPTENNLAMNLARVENERRDLIRSIIHKLNREALEALLVDAGLEHKAVMTNVIAANTKPQNWRADLQNAPTTTKQPQQQTFLPTPTAPSSALAASFVAKYSNHDLVTPPTERSYKSPYAPLNPIPTTTTPIDNDTSPEPPKKPTTNGVARSATRTSLPSRAIPTPKSTQSNKSGKSGKASVATKKTPVRAPTRGVKGTKKEIVDTPKQTQIVATTSSGRAVKRTKYTEVDTEEDESEEEEDTEDDLDMDDETVIEDEDDTVDTPPTTSASTMGPNAFLNTFQGVNGKQVKAKNTAEKNKEQTMIPVGILAGGVNVALAGFDRRMGLIFRTSRYNRDGEFVGLGEGMSRSIKRNKVDFHPVLSHLNEEDLRKEILRRQMKTGYQPPPGRTI